MKKRLSRAYYRAISPRNTRWQALRAARFTRQRGLCAVCGKPMARFDLHHTTYAHLGRESISQVRAVHRQCHKIADRHRKAAKKGKR